MRQACLSTTFASLIHIFPWMKNVGYQNEWQRNGHRNPFLQIILQVSEHSSWPIILLCIQPCILSSCACVVYYPGMEISRYDIVVHKYFCPFWRFKSYRWFINILVWTIFAGLAYMAIGNLVCFRWEMMEELNNFQVCIVNLCSTQMRTTE